MFGFTGIGLCKIVHPPLSLARLEYRSLGDVEGFFIPQILPLPFRDAEVPCGYFLIAFGWTAYGAFDVVSHCRLVS